MFASEDIAITIVTATEQIRGRLNIINRCESANELVLAYARLEDTLEDINSLNILQFTEVAGNIYTELVKQKIRIGTQDLRIAAITLSVNGILVTRNWKDFEKVPNLHLEDWSIGENCQNQDVQDERNFRMMILSESGCPGLKDFQDVFDNLWFSLNDREYIFHLNHNL